MTPGPRFRARYLVRPVSNGGRSDRTSNHVAGRSTRLSIRTQSVRRPSRVEPKAITRILGTLDDKIAPTRRMNATLEAMARALFQSWFVDFDPVHVKAAARQPTGIHAFTAALFPAGFQDSPLGEIPAGWEVKTVKDIGEVVCGNTPPTSFSKYYGDDVPFITIPDMHGNVFAQSTVRKLSNAGANFQTNKTLPPGSICVSCIATPGLVTITSESSQTNQQINSVIPREKDQTYFWYWTLKGLGADIASGGSGGSVLINLSNGRFEALTIRPSPRALVCSYHASVRPLFETISAIPSNPEPSQPYATRCCPSCLGGELRSKETTVLGEFL